MRIVLFAVGVLSFLSALAVILLYMTGHSAVDGEDTCASFIGCLVLGVVCLVCVHSAPEPSEPASSEEDET